MANILLVTEATNFITNSLVRKLESLGYIVIEVGNKSMEIDEVKDTLKMIVVYTAELIPNKKGLLAVKEKAENEKLPIVVIGDMSQLKDVETIIPKSLIKKELIRPINVKDTAERIDRYLKQGESENEDGNKQILVVDDSGAMLRNVKGWLEDKYQVSLANSGAMALKYLATNRPDLILLDYEMPICDGKQVLEMIRAEKDLADIPVIFLTGKNDKESVMKVTGLKPEGYMLKTMEPKQIVQKIDAFFENRRKM